MIERFIHEQIISWIAVEITKGKWDQNLVKIIIPDGCCIKDMRRNGNSCVKIYNRLNKAPSFFN